MACLALCLSCNEQISTTETKSMLPSIRMYYRVPGCNDGYCTYGDYLVLENYENNKYSINELAKLANSYIDTAKADFPISAVLFVGEEQGTHLPPGLMHRYYQHADKRVISFRFNNSLRDTLR